MGVPAFCRWLVKKYPKVVVDAIDESAKEEEEEDRHHSISSLPNPNGIEFDNLYLDMNGIIHPCFHPVDHDDPDGVRTDTHTHRHTWISFSFLLLRLTFFFSL